MTIEPFEFRLQTRIVFGVHAVDRLGDLVREYGAKRALVVTDAGVRAAGHVDRAIASLNAANITPIIFDDVHENPTTDDVERCVDVAREARIDFIIGLGGGSSMDCAKGCNFLLTNGGRMQDYWGIGKAAKPMLPFIAVPTTAGTGSEMQSFALIADPDTHQKMACGDRKALARVAILDPALAVTQPAQVIACSGLDTIAHAVESSVTRKRNAVSAIFSRESFRLAQRCFPRVLKDPSNLDAQSGMLLAAACGGIAIENSMLGAAHSMANPLTAEFGVVHGHAVGLALPHVVAFNAAERSAREVYDQLAAAGGLNGSPGRGWSALAARLAELLDSTGLGSSLQSCGVREDAIPRLADGAARQWTAQFNPRAVSTSDFIELYRSAFHHTVANPNPAHG